ncbi:AzlD domain-containing protein [Olsenella sp. Marseille-P4559]|uniref:AzlD domain-containing protein n=1 Tax=Olsenella sp. Marseille-P4559 TaxID=2364795 RepID=UPI00102FB8D0|nr:AzlD domain-containing protein [Olsenella sp. Marseille-P4559]
MSTAQFLVLWLSSFAFILACRVVPVVALRGRPLSPRVVEALGYIPPAAFAALVANDLLSPTMFDAGLWTGIMPILAAGIVVFVAWRTRSMLWCCVSGVLAYVLLSLI